jgi:hypothetical protein
VSGNRQRPRARCPACGARFRGTTICSRCGADLGAVMRLLAMAHRQRKAAVDALRSALGASWSDGRPALDPHRFDRATALAEAAYETDASRENRHLLQLLRALSVVSGHPESDRRS